MALLEPSSEASGGPRPAPVRTPATLPVILLAAAAVVLAGYLTWVSVREAGTPAGCGADSGCARVLASRWSRWFGVPVGGPALGVYLGILVAAGLAWRGERVGRGGAAWGVLAVLSAVAAGAAAWFLVLQVAVLRAFCPWCVALHTCGIVIFVLVLFGLRRQAQPAADVDTGAAELVPAASRPRVAPLVLAGLLGVGVLVAGQLFSKPARPPIRLSALPGIEVRAEEHPVLGTPDAEHVLVVLADYTCPHCRRLHGQLEAAMDRYGREQLAVAVVPVPLNTNCNDGVKSTEQRMREACDLARVALAVWTVDRSKYPQVDHWLFEPETPPSAEAARAFAATLVGAEPLARAIAGPAVNGRIAANVELYKAAGRGRLPKLLLPTHTAEGEADDEAALFALLEQHLGVVPRRASP